MPSLISVAVSENDACHNFENFKFIHWLDWQNIEFQMDENKFHTFVSFLRNFIFLFSLICLYCWFFLSNRTIKIISYIFILPQMATVNKKRNIAQNENLHLYITRMKAHFIILSNMCIYDGQWYRHLKNASRASVVPTCVAAIFPVPVLPCVVYFTFSVDVCFRRRENSHSGRPPFCVSPTFRVIGGPCVVQAYFYRSQPANIFPLVKHESKW